MSALSDSTTMMGSPASTLSPTFLSHDTIFPSVMVELSAGMNSSVVSTPYPPPSAGASSAAAVSAAAGAASAAPPPAATEAMSASLSAITATTAPTSATSPSPVRIFARKPSSNASTSMSALSDSTTMMASPADTASPSDFSHDTMRPSFMVDERAGMVMSIGSAMYRAVPAERNVATDWRPAPAMPKADAYSREAQATRAKAIAADGAVNFIFILLIYATTDRIIPASGGH